MKIAVSAAGPALDAEIDPRFGRCCYFLIVDTDTLEFEPLDNSRAMAGGGAGIATANTLVHRDLTAVLTGNCGPNAYQVLSAAGIKVITGVSGTVMNAVQNYKSGKLRESMQPNVDGHFGMGNNPGTGRGMRRGRGWD